jgi:replicative DNA helicase
MKKDVNTSPSSSSIFGLLPPQAVSEEDAIIIALLYHGGHIARVASILKPEMFYRQANGFIYEVILTMYDAGTPIELLAVERELRKTDKLSECGGWQHLEGMAERFIASGTAAFLEEQAYAVREKYTLREMIRIGSELIKSAHDETLDVQDVYATHLQAVQDVGTLIAGNDNTVTLREILRSAYSDMFKRMENFKKGVSTGIDTGLVRLNKYTSGWQPGSLIIVAGRPAMGKTALALHFAKTAGLKGESVLFFSLEMTAQQLADRLILSHTDIDGNRYRTGDLNEEDVRQVNESISLLEGGKITVDKSSSVYPSRIRSLVREQVRKGCRMVVIDYLGLVTPESKKKSFTRDNELGEITRALKLVAMENGVPVILLCQLNRKCEERPGKKPQLSDLRDSGNIEQDADVVLMVFRPAYYFNDEDMPNQYRFSAGGEVKANYGQIIIGKNRNGVVGTIEFAHNDTMTAVYDWDEDYRRGRTPTVPRYHSDYTHDPDYTDKPF